MGELHIENVFRPRGRGVAGARRSALRRRRFVAVPPALITQSQRAAPHPSVNTSAEYSFSRVMVLISIQCSEVGHGLSQHTRDRVEPWCLLQRTRAPRCGMHQWTSCRLLANSMFAKHSWRNSWPKARKFFARVRIANTIISENETRCGVTKKPGPRRPRRAAEAN